MLVLITILASLNVVSVVHAENVLSYLTDKSGAYIGPSLEDNVLAMDTDKNGYADVFEVRAYLELKHGKGYQKDVLDRMAASASSKSCGTTFANDLYLNKNNQ
jgi:hypothetical protein